MVKEKKGSNGSILFIVPGIYAREAVKAADRLHKGDYSAAVMALRFIFPSDVRKLSDTAAPFDLVVIADASDGSGGMKADLGLELMNLNKLQVAVAGKYMKGKALGDFASRVFRENRFRRTVDDVKKDRWR
jgi:transketolase C-terminal domain/subunit